MIIERRDWYRALQFYPCLIADAFFSGVPEEKIRKAAELCFLNLIPSRYFGLTKLKVSTELNEEKWFWNWLVEQRSLGARRAYVLPPVSTAPENYSDDFIYRPFSFVVEFSKWFETWHLYQPFNQLRWQLGREECQGFFDSPLLKEIKDQISQFISSSQYTADGEAGFKATIPSRSASASWRDRDDPCYSEGLYWLDDTIRRAKDFSAFTREAWDTWTLDLALGYGENVDPREVRSDEEDEATRLIFLKENDSALKPKEISNQKISEQTRKIKNLFDEAKTFARSQNQPEWERGFHRAQLRLSIEVDTDSDMSEVMILLRKSPEAIQLFSAARAGLQVLPPIWKQIERIELSKRLNEVCHESMLIAVNDFARRE